MIASFLLRKTNLTGTTQNAYLPDYLVRFNLFSIQPI
jgi:hypothetical protein